ncbi:MAG: energy-coupling factor ABC transporter ATP-binding protein [Leptotrichiaceae bacterium]|nr:energy-coupling factor ABC transporter ATP-binding protein [Leptotrichiaceae bacterium]
MSFIKMDRISFIYPDGTAAVDDISLNIEKGENVAIIGQNGAGKTTAVKMLNGLLKPVKGDVIVGDWNTKDYTTAQMSRKAGYVFQNPMDQIFHNNVYDEIAFGPKKLKYSESEIKKMTEQAVEMTQLNSYIRENPYNLPYSLRKFVTIASIIAMGTDVIVMDEPTAGQDLKGITILNELTGKLLEQGKTLITITHDMEFVVNNFNRVVVMANKKIIADGNKRDIFKEEDILARGKIKRPYISDLANELSMCRDILTIDDFINDFSKKY